MIEKLVGSLSNEAMIVQNREILRGCGCSNAQIHEFSRREFSALPKWLRVKLKNTGAQVSQSPKTKLNPKAGEYQFYIDPSRFPPQLKDGKMVFKSPPRVELKPALLTTEDIRQHRRGIQHKRTGIPLIDAANKRATSRIAKDVQTSQGKKP